MDSVRRRDLRTSPIQSQNTDSFFHCLTFHQISYRRFSLHSERFLCFKNLKLMDHPKKSEYNSSVQPRMNTARISRNQGGAGLQPATDRQDACPTLQSLFDLGANGGRPPRC